MCEGDLARTRPAASPSDEGGGRCGVVRRAKRRTRDEDAARDRAGNRMDARHFERLVGAKVRQDRRDAARQHRLADARRADEQQMMTTRDRDLECAAYDVQAAHIGEVEPVVVVVGGRAFTTPRAPGGAESTCGHGCSHLRQARSSPSERAGKTSMPATNAASAALSAGTTTRRKPAR